MPDFMLPLGSGLTVYPSGEQSATSIPALITAGVANTKGTWTAINAFDWDRGFSGFWITYRPVSANTVILMDIGYSLDSGTNWEVIAPNIIVNGGASTFRHIYFPRRVPAGARMGCRIQSATASTTLRCMVHMQPLSPGWLQGTTEALNWGPNTANSRGTAVDPGATANTKGAYTTFAGLSIVHKAHYVMLQVHTGGNTAPTAANWLLDVAFDAGSGTKHIVAGDIPYVASTTAGQTTPDVYGPFPTNIPGNATLHVRASCSITDATDRLLDCAVMVFH